MFTTMLLRPWAGAMIQRYGPFRVLRAVLAINAAALLLYTFSGIGLGGYLAARILQGVCTAFFSMALQLGIIDALPDKDRSQGISMYSLCASMPGVIGPLIAFGIWQNGDMQLFPATMIAIALLTAGVGYSARIEHRQAEPADAAPVLQTKQGTAMLHSFVQLVRNPHLFRCSVLMLSASLVFGTVTTFIPLYAPQIPGGHAGIYLMLQAGMVVAARFALRKKIPSDGKWHSKFTGAVMLLLTAAALLVSLASIGGALPFYSAALLMGLTQALLYPALTTYLTFVLPAAERNVLIGLFIATAIWASRLGAR